MDLIYKSFEEEKIGEAKERINGRHTWKTFRTDNSIQSFLEDFNRLPFVYTNALSCAGTYGEHPRLSFGVDEHPFYFLRNTNNKLLWQFALNYLHPDAHKLLNSFFRKISSEEFRSSHETNQNLKQKRTDKDNHPIEAIIAEQLEREEEFYVPTLAQNRFSLVLPFDVKTPYYEDIHLKECSLLEHLIRIHIYDKDKEVIGVGPSASGRNWWTEIRREYSGTFNVSITVTVPLFDVHEGKLYRRNITKEQFDKERKDQIVGLHEVVHFYI